MAVVYYTQLMSVAYGGSAKDAGLNGQLIKADKLVAIAGK
jgi:heterodisulfide reductase subunit B